MYLSFFIVHLSSIVNMSFFFIILISFFFFNYKRTEGVKISLRKFKCAQFQVFCCSYCTVCIRCCCWVCNPLWRGGTPSCRARGKPGAMFSPALSIWFCTLLVAANSLVCAVSLGLSLGQKRGNGHSWGTEFPPGSPRGHRGSQLCFLWNNTFWTSHFPDKNECIEHSPCN